jgi:hypothetical protein
VDGIGGEIGIMCAIAGIGIIGATCIVGATGAGSDIKEGQRGMR